MDDGMDDGTDGWKGRPPPSQPDKTKDIIYKDNHFLFKFTSTVNNYNL
jgi:hypothetical protein